MSEKKIVELMVEISRLKDDLVIIYKEKSEKEGVIENFDITDYFTEKNYETLINEENPYGVMVLGYWIGDCGTVLRRNDHVAFNEMYNAHIESMDKEDIKEYEELENELEEIKDRISEIEDEIESLEFEKEQLAQWKTKT